MKNLKLILLISLSSFAFADDVAIQRYMDTQVAVLEAQISQLYEAILILKTEKLSQQATFDRIGQPSFKAVDDALKNNGFSHSQFYGFADKHQTDILEWNARNAEKINSINVLTERRELLTHEYDQLIKTATSTK